MTRINLLPWREAERRRRQREFAIAGGLTFGMFLLFGLGLYFQIEMMIASQDARNRFLGDAIAILDVRLREIEKLEETKANLLARMHVIQELQAIRPEVVHLFDEVVEAMPEGVFLTRMVQTGTNVVVEGRAQSNARVSALMRAIQASPWISDPQLLAPASVISGWVSDSSGATR